MLLVIIFFLQDENFNLLFDDREFIWTLAVEEKPLKNFKIKFLLSCVILWVWNLS